MTQEVVNKAIVLYRLGIDRTEVEKAEEVFFLEPELQKLLMNPTITYDKKNRVIDQVCKKADLSEKMAGFIKKMCSLGYILDMRDIFDSYYKYCDKMENILRADLITAKKASKDLIKSAEDFLKQEYPEYKIVLTESIDEGLIGGYLIRLDGMEYDHSYEGRLRQLERKITGR